MASIVLTVAGGFFGGPIGAAIGATAGAVFDREVLFKPRGRAGPRLQELRVQTSSYGTQIPRLFGTMRVAGCVIWATELAEHRRTERAKGRPGTTHYSYTASFAVALSARPILGVGRIWADGKLLRGAGGDFKSATGFRLHAGGERQPADPLIAAAEGAALTPAHRGLAYAVFEDMALGDYGNRIPSLSFEVFADAGPVAAGAIAAALGQGVLACEAETVLLAGFAAQGADRRAAIETLAGAAGGWFGPRDGGLALLAGAAGETTAVDDAGARGDGGRGGRGRRAIAGVHGVPARLSLAHYDPARDYQTGVQRAARGGAGARETRVELPAAIDAGTAKTLAEAALARAEAERERRTVTLDWRAMTLRPGDRVTIGGSAAEWRVARWLLEGMTVTLECVPIGPAPPVAAASSGRALPAPDALQGTTILHAFELPPLTGSVDVPQLAIAAAGSGPGWRSAALLLSTDGGAGWSEIGGTAAPATIGTILVPPGAAGTTLVDHVHAIDIELAHAGMALLDADAAALANGANLALAGDELLQFATAEPLGGRQWRLRGLWRGRRGTEAAAGRQAAGDRFVLIERESLAVVPLPQVSVGSEVRVIGQGAGDGAAWSEDRTMIAGISLLPLAPVHLRMERRADGGAALRWTRRSRMGWSWVDGAEAPLGEEREAYRVEIVGEGISLSVEVAVPEILLDAGQLAGATAVQVRQAGTHGLSPPAIVALA